MLFLGVDGGGTKTVALVVDSSGQVIGWGSAGGSNYHLVGIDQAFASVKQSVDAALQGHKPDVIHYCMAGADMPHDFDQIRSKLAQLDLGCPFTVRNDVMGIFRAGSRFPFGVGVVCGTGFNAGGISQDGNEFSLPSLSQLTGDAAGARYLAVRAVGMVFRAWDGRGEPTRLADAILQALDAPNLETIAERWVQGELTQQRVNALAPLVFEISEAGDPVAQQLIHEQGVELGVSAVAMLRRLNLIGTDCDVVLGGSVVYGKGTRLMDAVHEVVGRSAPKALVCRLDLPPAVGAVLLAADKTGVTLNKHFIMKLRSTLPVEMQVPSKNPFEKWS